MRKNGTSIIEVHKSLGVPKSTLNGWFKDTKLSQEQIKILKGNQFEALRAARIKARLWHIQQKENRLKQAEDQAIEVLSSINFEDKNIQQLALAMLYLGEGFKADRELGIGNSDPLILKFFIYAYLTNFNATKESIRCELYLRVDQDAEAMKKYWAKVLDLPLKNFTFVHFDERTAGSKTYARYKGVCSLRCGNVAVKRKLMYIAEKYCKKIL